MFAGWLEMAGVELVNSARATVYAQALGVPGVGCDSCMCQHFGVGDTGPYTDPEVDRAPWLDPTVPASRRFGGFLGLSIDGLDDSTVARAVTPLVTEGALLGPPRRAPRQITVSALALACDEQALSYGLSWLASVLRGAGCGGTCGGADPLCALAWCPGEYATAAEWTDAVRHLYRVGLTGPPRVLNRYIAEPGTCNPSMLARVEYVLTAGVPWLFREPSRASAPTWAQAPAGSIVDPPPACPPAGGTCETDPDCPPGTPALPTVPKVPDSCDCTLGSTPWRSLVEVTPAGGAWLEAVPVIEIHTGSVPLDCLRVRFWTSPGPVTCAQAVADACNFCGELGVSWLPANAVFLLDGRNRMATIQCDRPGQQIGPSPNAPNLSGGADAQFTWPVFDCRGAVCFEFLANTAAPDVAAHVALVVREDAA